MYDSGLATNSLTISKLLGPACFHINTRLSLEEAISMSPVMFQCTRHTSTCFSLSRSGIDWYVYSTYICAINSRYCVIDAYNEIGPDC